MLRTKDLTLERDIGPVEKKKALGDIRLDLNVVSKTKKVN